MRKREMTCIRFRNTIHQAAIIHEWVEQSHDDNDVLKKLYFLECIYVCCVLLFSLNPLLCMLLL